ncbi:ABC transporter substrate-binding protein [Alicyclobacillus ferrooxydans]|uniref:Sugar ABC transporter substrate-binding protein n=1 Tax=Alicyclobacillus ferrooxydans TaxID=471514 RepID=A0A0P9GUR5_9BACL|nr:ABC transporter substrate-binding protein [Alicyclobacillus ferrooxydans]KPV45004.1 sugar ABC transporter substrate-binding protein [Alicyclobacillus ferrooxydans]
MKGLYRGGAILATLTVAGGLLAGCGTGTNNASNGTAGTNATTNSTNTAAGSGAGGVVNIVWAAPPITHTGLRQTLISKFNAEHPNIHVTLQDQNSNTDTNRASLTTTIGGGAATPDVYMGDVVWPAQFASNQLAMPLNGVVPSNFFNRFSKGLVQGATYQGKVYAAPFFADSGFLFYRKDLLKQAGLPVPTSWQQVQQEAETLQKKGLVQYGFVWQGASYEGLTCDFTEYLTDAGGQVLNSSGKAAIDSPQAIKALTFMRGLITSGVTPKSVINFQEPQSEDVFVQGNAAFLRNWSYAWSDSQNNKSSKVVGKVGVTVLPTFGGASGYSTIGGWDLYINPHTQHTQAAVTFIDWMTNTQAQTILAKQFSEIPTNAQVANDPSVQAVSPIFGLVSKTHYVSRPDQNPNYPAISKALYTNVNAALTGSVSVSAALQQAQTQINQAASGGGL